MTVAELQIGRNTQEQTNKDGREKLKRERMGENEKDGRMRDERD